MTGSLLKEDKRLVKAEKQHIQRSYRKKQHEVYLGLKTFTISERMWSRMA